MFENAKTKITEKSCLCVGLANASYLENDMKIKGQAQGVVICPDPIWLILIKKYRFLKWCSIFTESSVLNVTNRPNMFVKELTMYIDYLKMKLKEFLKRLLRAKLKKWNF
jgi:hypothetical protein